MIRSSRPDRIEETLVNVHAESEGIGHNGLQILLVILPNETGSYGKIRT